MCICLYLSQKYYKTTLQEKLGKTELKLSFKDKFEENIKI